ncbi:hypothetical protein MMC18_008094 [Xylographa bjoerkii]|nr:hypothetical protein [Xylographa bjoerkii]
MASPAGSNTLPTTAGTPTAIIAMPVKVRNQFAGTPNGKHIWTELELEHAIVLRQYGGISVSKISRLLNTLFSTNKTPSTVQNKLDVEAGTLCRTELERRKGKAQPPVSFKWERIEDIGADSLEVGSVFIQHMLITEEEWLERVMSHRLGWELQTLTGWFKITANNLWGNPQAEEGQVELGTSSYSEQ